MIVKRNYFRWWSTFLSIAFNPVWKHKFYKSDKINVSTALFFKLLDFLCQVTLRSELYHNMGLWWKWWSFSLMSFPLPIGPFLSLSLSSCNTKTLKIGLFGSITAKPVDRKSAEWSQKLLLGPLSTVDVSKRKAPFHPQKPPARRKCLKWKGKTHFSNPPKQTERFHL